MPHLLLVDSPVAFMGPDNELRMRQVAQEVMEGVQGSGFKAHQVHLGIPAETRLTRAYKPFMIVRFANQPGRSDDTLKQVCHAAAGVFYDYMKPLEDAYELTIDEIQYDWEIDYAGRFGRFPPRE